MFDGRRTACGQTFGPSLIGVAHKTLPCGTRVAFRYRGHVVVVRVVDRGPYVAGRQFDLTIGAARALHHVFTGGIEYRVLR
jgi:rare lipoprotein A